MKPGLWLTIIAAVAFCLVFLRTAANPESETETATEVAVKIGRIEKTTLNRFVTAYGLVEPQPAMAGKPAASSKIASPVAGILSKVFCEEGQPVKKGDLLFELDTRTADALVAKTEVAVEFAQKNFARKQQLKATDNVSTKLYDEAEQLLQTARKDLANARTQLDLLRIKAPLNGTVSAIRFKAGEAVGLNTALADLVDLERLDIALKIPSREAASLRLGQPVAVNQDSNAANTAVSGRVIFISPQIAPLTDTVLVRASFPGGAGLRDGQFVQVRVKVEELTERLGVPVESVVHGETDSTIAVVNGDFAKRIPVKTGLRDGDRVEINGDGLTEGMTVVTEGAYGLPDATRIRVIEP